MKKMVLGLTLVLTALGLMTSPAMADPGSQPVSPVLSAADQVFLASLTAPAPVPEAKRPRIEGKALCTATVDCGATTVTCSSNSSSTSCSAVDRHCPGTRGSVTCDGVTAQCPLCLVVSQCAALQEQCTEHCACGVMTFQCDPYVCTCKICP